MRGGGGWEQQTFFMLSKFIGVLIFLLDFSNSASAYGPPPVVRSQQQEGTAVALTASIRLGFSAPSRSRGASSQWARLGERCRRSRERRGEDRPNILSAIALATTE